MRKSRVQYVIDASALLDLLDPEGQMKREPSKNREEIERAGRTVRLAINRGAMIGMLNLSEALGTLLRWNAKTLPDHERRRALAEGLEAIKARGLAVHDFPLPEAMEAAFLKSEETKKPNERVGLADRSFLAAVLLNGSEGITSEKKLAGFAAKVEMSGRLLYAWKENPHFFGRAR